MTVINTEHGYRPATQLHTHTQAYTLKTREEHACVMLDKVSGFCKKKRLTLAFDKLFSARIKTPSSSEAS